MTQGFLRDADGALVIVEARSAATPITYVNGFLRDADGALVVVSAGG